MNQSKRDWLQLFFRRDSFRERIYPTRVTYLALAVVVMMGLALFLAGADRLRESLGLAALRPPATQIASQPTSGLATMSTPTTTVSAPATTIPSPVATGGLPTRNLETALPPTPAPAAASRCPVTWHVQEVAKSGGGRMGMVDDNNVAVQVRQDFREAMAWANSPSGPWNLAEVNRYYTPRMAGEVRAGLQLSLNRNEYVQVEMADLGTLSLSFTPDGSGVTFMSVQYEPITQTIRDTATNAVKRTVVLDDVPFQQVGIAMLYDTQACRWKMDRIEYPEPVLAP
jgi:hypothetical protein